MRVHANCFNISSEQSSMTWPGAQIQQRAIKMLHRVIPDQNPPFWSNRKGWGSHQTFEGIKQIIQSKCHPRSFRGGGGRSKQKQQLFHVWNTDPGAAKHPEKKEAEFVSWLMAPMFNNRYFNKSNKKSLIISKTMWISSFWRWSTHY